MDHHLQGNHTRFFLGFKDNVGEDGLSSQLTYKGNSDCPYYKASIAPNKKILNDLKPSKGWKKFMGNDESSE
jgi:hypothetical protein